MSECTMLYKDALIRTRALKPSTALHYTHIILGASRTAVDANVEVLDFTFHNLNQI